MQTSATYNLEYESIGGKTLFSFQVYVKDPERKIIPSGNYYIRHIPSDTYMTNNGNGISPVFRAKDDLDPLTQQWKVNNSSTLHSFMSLSDSMYVNKDGDYSEREIKGFRFSGAKGSEWLAIQKNATSGNTYWGVEADGNINFAFSKDPVNYEFEFIPVNGESDIQAAEYDHLKVVKTVYYSPEGIGSPTPHRGINIRMTTYENGTVRKDKIIIK